MAEDSALAEDPIHVGSSQNIGRLTTICNSGGIITSASVGTTLAYMYLNTDIHIHVIKKQ